MFDLKRKANELDDNFRGRIKAAPFNAGGTKDSLKNIIAFIVGIDKDSVIIEDDYTGADGKYGHCKIKFLGHTIEYDWSHLEEMVQFRKAIGIKVDILAEIIRYMHYIAIQDSNFFEFTRTIDEQIGISDIWLRNWELQRGIIEKLEFTDANNRWHYTELTYSDSLNLSSP